MTRLHGLLDQLGHDRLTGRVSIKGSVNAWVYLHEGRIYCAEQRDRASLLVAMAEAALFTPEEWQHALRLPVSDKWRALAHGDEVRLDELAAFAKRFVANTLAVLLTHDQHDHGTPAFAPAIRHPFGPLRAWTLDELLEDAAEEFPTPGFGPAHVIDREEFLELLEEVSPLVRRHPFAMGDA